MLDELHSIQESPRESINLSPKADPEAEVNNEIIVIRGDQIKKPKTLKK